MSDMTQDEYDAEVASTAMNILDKIEEHPEDYENKHYKAFEEETDWHNYVTKQSYYLDVLRYSSRGPDEWKARVANDEKNHWKVLRAMAYSAFTADVTQAKSRIEEARERLGDAIKLIEGPMYGEGVTVTYDYKPVGNDDGDTVTYTFEALVVGEWGVTDPDGNRFEVISPEVMVENSTTTAPAKALLEKLEAMCCKRQHEVESV